MQFTQQANQVLHGATKPVNRRREDALENSPMVRRAIELTANLAERRGMLGSVERSLRDARSGVPSYRATAAAATGSAGGVAGAGVRSLRGA